jgi:hypothetical protein
MDLEFTCGKAFRFVEKSMSWTEEDEVARKF